MSRGRAGSVLALAAAAGLALSGPSGCATEHPKSSTDSVSPVTGPVTGQGPALRNLHRLAQREAQRADRSVMNAPPPPGLAILAGLENEGPEAQSRRQTPLPDLLRTLAQPVSPPPSPEPPPTAGHLTQALRLYATGREKLLRGNAPAALADLKQATELDPTSGEAWLALGEAQGATGARAESLASMARGADLGAGGARPWEVLGRAALATGNNAKAAAYLARAALQPDGAGTDPALQSLIGIELGQALDGLGYARAAVESLMASLELLGSVQGTQRYRAEIAAIARRRGDLWVRVGDLACRAGDFARAATAYNAAWNLVGPGPARDGLTDRLVFAGLRNGWPGAASVIVYETIAGREGWVADGDFDLAEYLRTNAGSEAPGSLSAALNEYARTRVPAATPALESRLTVAQALLLPERKKVSLLEDRTRQIPSDDAASLMLLKLEGAESTRQAVDAAVKLTSRAPLRAETYARALLGMASLPDLFAALDANGNSEAADLLAGRMLGATDQADPALDRLHRAAAASKPGSLLRLGVDLAVVEVAASEGRWMPAETALNELNADWPGLDEPSVLWARAGGLAAAQRFGTAQEVLAQLADAPAEGSPAGLRVEYLVAAGELASRLSLGSSAQKWMEEASALDPYEQRVYARLLGLYAPGGAMENQGKVSEVIRQLRQNCPEGRVFRTLRAQDLLRRGSPEEALRQTLSLVRDDTSDGSTLQMLADACARMAPDRTGPDSPAEAEAFLRAHVARAPDDAPAVVTLARIVAGRSGTEEAELLLLASLASTPQREVQRALESLLRQSPSRVDEADGLALKRLGAGEIGTSRERSITEAIELAELLQHLSRTAEAAAILRDGIPAAATLSPNQARVLLDLATRATTGGGNAANPGGLAMIDIAAERGVELPQDLHGRRLLLMIADPRTTPQSLVAAAKQAEADHPDLGAFAFVFVERNLAALEAATNATSPPRPGRALEFAELAAAARPDPNILAEWLMRVGDAGDAQDAKRMIDSTLAAGLEGEVIRLVSVPRDASGAPEPPPPTGKSGGAELAWLTSYRCSFRGRDAAAAEMCRLALTYDPAHAWAANDLGYHLAETARRPDGTIDTAALEESERLLIVASTALPEDGSILDSLGWVRYRRLMLTDRKDEAGRLVLEGAVTLLSRAVRTSKGVDNQTILDHLGDALWLAGNRDTAAGAWAMSEQAARQRLDALRGANAPRQALESVSATLAQVSAKLAAVRAGLPPDVGWTVPGS